MSNVKSETYIFIVWDKARFKSDEIINDLNKNFIIRDIIEVSWTTDEFLNNLKRFYGQTLPDAKQKAKICGTGPFLLIVVSDPNPKFIPPSKSSISSERDYVNTNIFNSKDRYRKLIGKEFSVHSSVSKNETDHNLTLLFGKNLEDFTKNLSNIWDKKLKKFESNLIGTKGWKNMDELFYVMNGTINYVILRNFEEMPHKFDYNDVDLLVDDEKLAYIVKKDFSPEKDSARSIKLKIDNQDIILNPNYVGDHYFDEQWENDILNRRILHSNGFYIPDTSDYFYTLLYHVHFHGRWKKIPIIRDDYKKLLLGLSKKLHLKNITESSLNNKNVSRKIIENFLKKSSYKRTDTFRYKIRYNETSRLLKRSIFILKTHGISYFLFAIKEKIRFILKLR